VAYRFAANQAISTYKIAADLRPSAGESAVRNLWWLAVADAGSQRAYSLGSCAMGQTDGRAADERITLFRSAPPGWGRNKNGAFSFSGSERLVVLLPLLSKRCTSAKMYITRPHRYAKHKLRPIVTDMFRGPCMCV